MSEKIFILLPVHNRKDVTARLIGRLKAQTYQNYQLILIDDGSSDGTEEMVRANIHSLTVIKGGGNWWWAGSLQQGIDWLKKNPPQLGDIILMINDDVEFDEYFLESATKLLRPRERTLLLAQFLDPKTGRPVETGVEANLRRFTFKVASSPDKINCLSTRGLFMRWADLIEIGDFHPKLLPHYGSDYEFTIRAHKKGFHLDTSADLVLIPNLQTTGFRHFDNIGFTGIVRAFLSKRSIVNPFYQTSFAILVSRKILLPAILARVWGRALRVFFRNIYFSKRDLK